MNRTLKVIEALETNRVEMNISRDSIEFISSISRFIKPRKSLEIGAFNGYSTLWLSLFSKNVISLEIDQNNINIAKTNFKEANCKNVEIIHGNAIESLKKLKVKFDLILIDGKKAEYKDYLDLSLKLLNKNGLIFADNTISHKDGMSNFFEYLNKSDLFFKELNLGKGLMIISKKIP